MNKSLSIVYFKMAIFFEFRRYLSRIFSRSSIPGELARIVRSLVEQSCCLLWETNEVEEERATLQACIPLRESQSFLIFLLLTLTSHGFVGNTTTTSIWQIPLPLWSVLHISHTVLFIHSFTLRRLLPGFCQPITIALSNKENILAV